MIVQWKWTRYEVDGSGEFHSSWLNHALVIKYSHKTKRWHLFIDGMRDRRNWKHPLRVQEYCEAVMQREVSRRARELRGRIVTAA